MSRHTDWARRIWARVTEPKSVTVAQVAVYVIVGLAGVLQLFDPSRSTQEVWDKTWTTIWACILIGGGGIGATAAPYGVWWLERIAITTCATGGAMYLAANISAAPYLSGGRAMVIAGWVIVLLHLLIRYLRIRHSQYEPGR